MREVVISLGTAKEIGEWFDRTPFPFVLDGWLYYLASFPKVTRDYRGIAYEATNLGG